jgi:alcohol dehydrogenase class IV
MDGLKQSLNKNVVLPSYAILDASLLISLPDKVLISSVLDAFAQSVESFWSRKATKHSQKYSVEAISIIYPILKRGIDRSIETLEKLQYASNLAGKAINITTTTAAHALSYNITKLFGIPHGIAVCMILPHLWGMHNKKLLDFDSTMSDLICVTNHNNNTELIDTVSDLFRKLNVSYPLEYTEETLEYLVNNVNLERLSNNPYELTKEEIRTLYVLALS